MPQRPNPIIALLPASALPLAIALVLSLSPRAFAQGQPTPDLGKTTPASLPATNPGKLPHVQVDAKAKQVRIECEAVNANAALEFFVCSTGTQEHETVLRTLAKPSHIHLALLMCGLEPGEPSHFSQATQKWLPPKGPPVHITAQFLKNGKAVSVPAYRLMRNVKTKKEMPPLTWVFTGSRQTQNGEYAADLTGYVISVVNFDYTCIDIPEVATADNETLEWEANADALPARGTTVWLVVEPAGKVERPHGGDAAPQKADPQGQGDAKGAEAQAAAPTTAAISEVTADEAKIKRLRARWEKAVAPRHEAMKEAAQAHYEVIGALRAEQQRLIDEADRIQRVIDELQKEYQDMTTPRPEAVKGEG